MSAKIKTYVLMVSRTFPADHPRKGEPTFFIEKIKTAVEINLGLYLPKLHTIRGNYKLWEKRMKAIQEEKAVLKICYWLLPGGRFKKGNQPVEICQFNKNSGVGVQKLQFFESDIYCPYVYGENGISNEPIEVSELAKNDGLSLTDFKDWFRKYDKSEPMAIIHFTPFRY